jgi:hypothetical protein
MEFVERQASSRYQLALFGIVAIDIDVDPAETNSDSSVDN